MNSVEKIICFNNGMIAVFDNQGQQIPELQGRVEECLIKAISHSNSSLDLSIDSDIEKKVIEILSNGIRESEDVEIDNQALCSIY